MGRKRKGMGPCPAHTRAGQPCPNNGHVSDGFLCHVHKEDAVLRIAAYLLMREQELAKDDPARAVAYQKVRCVGVNADGSRCRHWIRSVYGPRCSTHGGGRNGLRLIEAATVRAG